MDSDNSAQQCNGMVVYDQAIVGNTYLPAQYWNTGCGDARPQIQSAWDVDSPLNDLFQTQE